MVGMYYVTKGRQRRSMGCVSLAIIYTHVPFPHRLSCTWKSNPSRQQAKTFAFLSHTGVLEARIFVGKETTCIIMGTSLVNWLRTCIFTASTRSRRGGVGGGGFAGWVASTLCCSSQWILGPASSKQCGEMSRCPHVVAAWAVKLREWALWLAGSSFPFINNKCYHKIKTVTKRRRCTNQDSLSRCQKATHVMHQLGDPSFVFGLLFFFISLSDNCQVRTQLKPTQTRFCSTIHSGHTHTHDIPHINVQTNKNTFAFSHRE